MRRYLDIIFHIHLSNDSCRTSYGLIAEKYRSDSLNITQSVMINDLQNLGFLEAIHSLSLFIMVYKNHLFPVEIQEVSSGNHTDIRWFRVQNAEGLGLEFYSNAPMEASALKFLTEDLDDGLVKDKKIDRHSGDLTERPQTQVHLQQRQMGMGCVNSWGAWPRKEYRLEYKDYDFTFAIKPVHKTEKK